MASPQKENGYTAIANELLEHLSHPGINGSEYRVLLVVLRKTYGFQKTRDKIALSQFQKMTLMNRAHVIETIKSLVHKSILVKVNNLYSFNKNWEEWVVCKRVPSTQKHTTASTQKHTKISTQKHTHKRKKETITKETTAMATPSPFLWDDYLTKMDSNPQRFIQIISYFFREKKIKFDSLAKAQTAIRRHLRSAKQLEPFSDAEINKATLKAKDEYEGLWTIETLVKILTR